MVIFKLDVAKRWNMQWGGIGKVVQLVQGGYISNRATPI